LNRLAAVACTLAFAATAHASDPPDAHAPPAVPIKPPTFAESLVHDIHALVDAAIVARPPKLVPPKPLKRAYKLAKLGTLDLGSPLATLAAGDLDGDRKGELYAVTATDVIAIGWADGKLRELGRVAFTGERPAFGPRDVVATATLAPAEPGIPAGLVATVSTYARGMRVYWKAGALVATLEDKPGFLACPGERLVLAPGRNYFGDATNGAYTLRCTSGLVDADGYPLRARAQLALTNKLDVAVERCAATDFKCQPAARVEHVNVGIAFDITDVDRDGVLELVYAAAGAPGDPDILRVLSLGEDEKKQKLKKSFTAGGIAGIATTDLDGDDVPETVAAVRLVGASRIDLWRLE
jgi:hypothetical protein